MDAAADLDSSSASASASASAAYLANSAALGDTQSLAFFDQLAHAKSAVSGLRSQMEGYRARSHELRGRISSMKHSHEHDLKDIQTRHAEETAVAASTNAAAAEALRSAVTAAEARRDKEHALRGAMQRDLTALADQLEAVGTDPSLFLSSLKGAYPGDQEGEGTRGERREGSHSGPRPRSSV